MEGVSTATIHRVRSARLVPAVARRRLAVVCGTISSLVVLDSDPRNGDAAAVIADRLAGTPTVESGGGGRHYWFLVRGVRIPKVPGLLPGLDLQAESSYVIAPPSIHASGRPYRWLPGFGLGERPLAPLPTVVRSLIAIRLGSDEEPPRRHRRVRSSLLTLDTVLCRLDGVRRCGRGWVARCPAHEDREPSLSIAQGTRRRVLLHCFAGCLFRDIVRALTAGGR